MGRPRSRLLVCSALASGVMALGLALVPLAPVPAQPAPPPPLSAPASAPAPTPAPQSAPRPEIRGVWLTLNDMPVLRDRERMRAALADLERLHVNTLYPVVWNGGYAWYPSEVMQRRGLQHFTPRGLQGQDTL
ncbi:MAG: family 10 glycosylhydrolase, partial [Synechococcaceae cyanobacterium]|nr:family 10 glycosylhydrolase [Synechococcaceae cyanobacterium]